MCPSCHHYIEALSQQCFIQVAKTPEEERAERQTKTWLSSAWCCCRLGHRALQQRRCALHFSSFTSCRRCQPCCKLLVGCKQQQEYLCGYVMCPSFHHYIEALSQRCFIQVAKTPEDERAERRAKQRPGCRLRGAAAGKTSVTRILRHGGHAGHGMSRSESCHGRN